MICCIDWDILAFALVHSMKRPILNYSSNLKKLHPDAG